VSRDRVIPGRPIDPRITPRSIAALQGESPNILRGGHGWVIPNPDGGKANCGGPMVCRMCHLEYLALQTTSRVSVMEGWVLKPGDKVLLLADPHFDPEDMEHIKSELLARFPEVDITIMQGFTGLQVHRQEASDNISNA